MSNILTPEQVARYTRVYDLDRIAAGTDDEAADHLEFGAASTIQRLCESHEALRAERDRLSDERDVAVGDAQDYRNTIADIRIRPIPMRRESDGAPIGGHYADDCGNVYARVPYEHEPGAKAKR